MVMSPRADGGLQETYRFGLYLENFQIIPDFHNFQRIANVHFPLTGFSVACEHINHVRPYWLVDKLTKNEFLTLLIITPGTMQKSKHCMIPVFVTKQGSDWKYRMCLQRNSTNKTLLMRVIVPCIEVLHSIAPNQKRYHFI